jgi:hypothetical protein
MSNETIVTYHCEHEFWKDYTGIILPGWFSEPLCAVSGLFMCGLALLCTANLEEPPLQFCLARASLVVCGLGTAAYHMMDQGVMNETRINGNILDGVTMAMVSVNLFLLHLSNRMKRHLMAMSVLVMLYLLFWATTNDMLMFTFLQERVKVDNTPLISVGVQYPSFVVVYLYIVCRVLYLHGIYAIYPMCVFLGIALASWVANTFGCGHWKVLFIGHVVWHVCVGYVAVYLMVLGLLNGDEYVMDPTLESNKYWIHVIKKPYVISDKKSDSNESGPETTRVGARLDVGSMFNTVYQSRRLYPL